VCRLLKGLVIFTDISEKCCISEVQEPFANDPVAEDIA
jgi:hypothetical protein